MTMIHDGRIFQIEIIGPGQFKLTKTMAGEGDSKELVETDLGVHPTEARARQRMSWEIKAIVREAKERAARRGRGPT